MSVLDRLKFNWRNAPGALRTGVVAWLLFSVLMLVLMPKLTALVRLGLTILLLYHLLNKSQVARGLVIGCCVLAALFAISALAKAPVAMGGFLVFSLVCICYLAFSSVYKTWLKVPSYVAHAEELHGAQLNSHAEATVSGDQQRPSD